MKYETDIPKGMQITLEEPGYCDEGKRIHFFSDEVRFAVDPQMKKIPLTHSLCRALLDNLKVEYLKSKSPVLAFVAHNFAKSSKMPTPPWVEEYFDSSIANTLMRRPRSTRDLANAFEFPVAQGHDCGFSEHDRNMRDIKIFRRVEILSARCPQYPLCDGEDAIYETVGEQFRMSAERIKKIHLRTRNRHVFVFDFALCWIFVARLNGKQTYDLVLHDDEFSRISMSVEVRTPTNDPIGFLIKRLPEIVKHFNLSNNYINPNEMHCQSAYLTNTLLRASHNQL